MSDPTSTSTTTNGDHAVKDEDTASQGALPMFVPSDPAGKEPENENNLDLDDLFRDCYFGDFPVPPANESDTPSALLPNSAFQQATAAVAALPSPATVPNATSTITTTPNPVAPSTTPTKRKAEEITASSSIPLTTAMTNLAGANGISTTTTTTTAAAAGTTTSITTPPKAGSSKPLTDQQKVERRERNRKHAKRSRLRKKFLLESLQEQINGLQSEIDGLKNIIRTECPDKADSLLEKVSGPQGQFTPLPMPSGFGPVKTLMEPDFRLMSALSGSQQNFAISDPSLPDNPIVYVSQGFLDLTGYTLDQVLGRNCRFLQGPGTDQSAVDIIRKGVREGVDTSVCLLNYKADGTPFWNQFFVAALRDAENNVVNFVGVQCEVSKAVVEKQMLEQQNASGTDGDDAAVPAASS